MPEALGAALDTPGLPWLLFAISVAGIVRGFTGFGTALIFVPVAGQFLPPAPIITMMTLTGILATITLIPRAWPDANRREVGILALAAMVTVPLGVAMMAWLDPVLVRWIVAGIGTLTLVVVISGWRYEGRLGRKGLSGIGVASGIVGGMTGLTGAMVIMFYLASRNAARVIRANTILFLAIMDVMIFVTLVWRGLATWDAVALVSVLAIPYLIASLIGQALFAPEHERVYRVAAYLVIGLAVIVGLPIFD